MILRKQVTTERHGLSFNLGCGVRAECMPWADCTVKLQKDLGEISMRWKKHFSPLACLSVRKAISSAEIPLLASGEEREPRESRLGEPFGAGRAGEGST